MSRLYKRSLLAALVLGLLGTLFVPATAAARGAPDGAARTYLVTIENLTGGQPFTPPVAVTHQRRAPVFEAGAVASAGVQGLAENGDVPGLVAEQTGADGVGVVTVGSTAPVLPGERVTFEVEAVPGRRYLSVLSMLICTNDGLAAMAGMRLPAQRGETIVSDLAAYDAGTEINTEDFDDLVPPCGPLTGVDSAGAGTGMSNPALAEGGVIAHHGGIVGDADLQAALHGWTGPVGRISVTRIDGAAKYELTIANDTMGQPFTPPVAAVHRSNVDLFDVGDAASVAIQGLAENGDVPGLVATLAGDPDVAELVVGSGPVLPGTSVTYTFYVSPAAKRLSYASMLICTNDGFTGLDSVRLPKRAGDTLVFDLDAYDAGTEINTEDFDDLVPPCGPLTGVDSAGAGTGMSNPALAEGGVIAHHGGIVGDADLQAALHGWAGPVGSVTVTRLG